MIEQHLQLRRLWESDRRYVVLHGGRGSGKSYAMADYSIQQARLSTHNILAARQFQVSIADSIHSLLRERIHTHGLQDEFVIGDRRIYHKVTGSSWMFRGLERHAGSLQSLQGLTLVLVEEGQHVTEAGWRALRPTVRAPGSRIIVAMNPRFESDPIYRDLLADDAPYAEHVESIQLNWEENPHWTPALELERSVAEAGDAALYQHVWGGQLLIHSDASIYRRWKVVDGDPDDLPPGCTYRYGLDIGMTVAPSAAVRVQQWRNPNGELRVHVSAERYSKGLTMDTVAPWLESIYAGVGERLATSDQQALVTGEAHMASDWTIRHAIKGPGSLDQGIRWLQGARITIDASCRNTAREIALYHYKVDKVTEAVLPEVEKNQSDHTLDAIRYALERDMAPFEQPTGNRGAVGSMSRRSRRY